MAGMNPAALTPETEIEVWMRILHPGQELTPQVARAVLRLAIPDGDVARMRELSAKARAGTLTAEEDAEMDAFERVGATLSVLKSKARQVLARSGRGG